MNYLRTYGMPPYTVAVVHGGPGAPGSMAPVARELSQVCGVIEHLESAMTIDGQVAELHDILQKNGQLPITLIGHSWGAWLCMILAVRYPEMVKKLILVCSGPFEERYVPGIMETRLSRLSEEEKGQVQVLTESIMRPAVANRSALLSIYGTIMSKADAYDPIPEDEKDKIEFHENVYQTVWLEAMELRRSGKLLALAEAVRCPVLAIHGDYDPHPAAGVQEPLGRAMEDFRFVLLEKCGHEPWKERASRDRFYEILKSEIS